MAGQVPPAHPLADGQASQLLAQLVVDGVAQAAGGPAQEGQPHHETRRLGGHTDHVEGGRLLLLVPHEPDVGVCLQQTELGPVLEDVCQLAGGLPALDGVVAAVGGGGEEVLGQGVVVLQHQADPVGVHPAVPDGQVQAADRLPELGEHRVGEVRRVEDWRGGGGRCGEQGQAVPGEGRGWQGVRS